MPRKMLLVLTALLLVVAAVPGIAADYDTARVVRDIQKGVDNQNAVETLLVTGGATVRGDATFHVPMVTVTITNGSTVTLQAGKINRLVCTNMADTLTSTNTLGMAAATDLRMPTYVLNDPANSSNNVLIQKAGVFYGDAVTLGTGDCITVFYTATNRAFGQ